MGWLDRLFGTREEPEPVMEMPAPPTGADIDRALQAVDAMLRHGQAPPVVIARVARIGATIRATLPRLDQLGAGSVDAYSVVATATDYLPEAVSGYLRLPRDWANTRPIDGHKSALVILIEQLDLLAATMDKILDAANRSDAAALLAHGRFLQAKFGTHGTGDLDLSVPTPADAGSASGGSLAPPRLQPPGPTSPLDLS